MYKQRKDDEKMKHKKLFAILTLVCFMFTLMPVAAMAEDNIMSFSDVQPSDWYYTAVQYAAKEGIMTGTGDNSFSPNATLTRATLMTVLHRMEGSPAGTGISPFEDVADGQWYTEAIIWAAANKIAGGYSADAFGPNDPLTREQLAAFMQRYAMWKGIDVSVGENTNILSYNDAFSISEWAYGALQWACGAGLIGSVGDGKLDPQGTATRAQMAAIMQRFDEKVLTPAEEKKEEDKKQVYSGGGGYVSHSHSYGVWTANNDGTHTKSCSCGNTVTEDCTMGAIVSGEGTHSQTCVECGYVVTESCEYASYTSWSPNEGNVTTGSAIEMNTHFRTGTCDCTGTVTETTGCVYEFVFDDEKEDHVKQCETCGYKIDERTDCVFENGECTISSHEHQHDYVAGYVNNADGTHNAKCRCGALDEAEECIYDTIKVVDGFTFEACVCGNTTERIIVATDAELVAALNNSGAEYIILKAGQYGVVDVTVNRTLTLVADDENVKIAGIDGQSNNNTTNITFKGVTIDNSLQTEGWYIGTSPNIKPCVGVWGGNYTFENCTFYVTGESKAETGVMSWWTTNKGTMNFKDCTFNGGNSNARAMQIYGNYDLNVESCTFNTEKDYSIKYVGAEGTKATFKNNTVNKTKNFVQTGSKPYAGENYALVFEGNVLAEGINHVYVDNDENQSITINGILHVLNATGLSTALMANEENVTVVLLNNIDLPIASLGTQTAGSGEYKLGGENTKAITIDLNGKKLNITTTYWSAIGAKNADAKITIKNGSMTSTGNSANTWNARDVRFSNCDYVIENVTFDKAIAFDNVGHEVTLKTVTINETTDNYAVWITAEGQKITIDGLNINSAGRGIKIDEQYVDTPAKVTLNVSNANFNTAKKAAILVKSAAGADITLNNINISGVVADTINAVWVDEDSATYANLVTVTGGKVITEE